VDAACGSGYGARLLAASGAARVTAFDVSPEAVREGQAAHLETELAFAVADARALPLPDARCDVYVSFETIEHIQDDAAYVREARRVVRPGGLFVCSTPNRALLNAGKDLVDAPFNPFHVREYLVGELADRLREVFSEVTLYGQTPFSGRYVRGLAALG